MEEPDRDRRWVYLRPFRFQPAVNVVVRISLDGLQVELAGDLDDGLALQTVHFDRVEILLHLAQRLDEIVGREMPEEAAPRFAPLRTFLECLVEVANAAFDGAVSGAFLNFVGTSLILEALQDIGA